MIRTASLNDSDVDAIIERLARHQELVARDRPGISATVDRGALVASIEARHERSVVAWRADEMAGYLSATTMVDTVFGRSAWINPDGACFDDLATLDALYVALADALLDDGYCHHYVLTPDSEIQPWIELGFALVHRGGVARANEMARPSMPGGLEVRRGDASDLEFALALDEEIDLAQRAGPSYATMPIDPARREDWTEMLADDTVHHYLIVRERSAVAQCTAFTRPAALGVHPRTLHLSALSVAADERDRGIGAAFVGEIVARESSEHDWVSATWRVTNRGASRFWSRLGFEPTYARLRRHVGDG